MTSAPGLLAAAAPARALDGAAAHIPHPTFHWVALLPVVTMLGGAVVLLGVASLVAAPLRVRVATLGTVAISATALCFGIWQWTQVAGRIGPSTTMDKAIAVDGLSALVAVLVPAAMIVSALVGDGYLRREGIEGPEFHVLAMISASGAMVMAQANDLIVVFLGLEILSIALYVLAAMNHKRAASGESALKYFILGGFSSAIFVYGIALVYGATGSTNLTQIADFLSRNLLVHDGLLIAGLCLLLVGFAFKVAAVPFHMWTPDVYQGAPSPVTGFMAAVAKVGAFAALLRVFVSSFGSLAADWHPVVYVLAVVTLVVGAGLAVVQRDIKRMLAYSSINHAGFILLGVYAATRTGVSASLYYLFAYAFMVIGSFAVVAVVGGEGDVAHDIAGYRGLARRQPLLALSFAVLLLAQAGAPFTTGLWAKLEVVKAAVDAGAVPLAAVAMVSAAIAVFFYLRVAVLMYAPATEEEPATALPPVALAVATAATGSDGAPEGVAPGVGDGTLALKVRLNDELLLEDVAGAPGPPADTATAAAEEAATEQARIAVPALSALAIALCLGVTVGFGIVPTALLSFAHNAHLLFLP